MLHREMTAKFQNTELCRLTEQVIFTDPYYTAPVNRHTSPQLDAIVAALQQDDEAKAAATRLKVESSSMPCEDPRNLHQQSLNGISKAA